MNAQVMETFVKSDGRLTDNTMDLFAQKFVLDANVQRLKYYRKKQKETKFNPVGYINSLAITNVLKKLHIVTEATNELEHIRNTCVLAKKTSLVGVFPPDTSVVNFPSGTAGMAIDERNNEHVFVFPNYESILVPVFNSESEHWSLLVVFPNSAFEKERRMGRTGKLSPEVLSSLVWHFDSLSGLNQRKAVKVVHVLQTLGYLPHCISGIIEPKEPMDMFQQTGNWECGYYALQYCMQFCEAFVKYGRNASIEVFPAVSMTDVKECKKSIYSLLERYKESPEKLDELIGNTAKKLRDICIKGYTYALPTSSSSSPKKKRKRNGKIKTSG